MAQRQGRPLSTGGLPLTWRVAVLASVAIAMLSLVGSVAAYLVVRNGLHEDLRRSLRDDASTVAALYREGGQGSATTRVTGPTGGVVVQVYDPLGRLLVASKPEFERAQSAIPPSDVVGATQGTLQWRGLLNGRPMEASMAPFDVGVVAVLADPAYIDSALQRLARALLITALALVPASAAFGYAVAASALRPLTRLAQMAAALGPDHLDAIPYDGPRDEVGRLTRSLNALLARLRTSRDAQRSFLAETSHELRTPLTSLQGFLDRAARRVTGDARGDLQDARRVSAGMARLVEDLLQLSRGELVRELEPHLLDPLADVLRPVAEEFPGVEVAGQAGALIVGDPDRLRQLVRNLTANAVRATGGGAGVRGGSRAGAGAESAARVVLSAEQDGSSVRLRVSDDGPGIPAELLDHIFDKFYKGAGGGAGLGLAIARQIARHHGGELSVESAPGRTVFEVRLPSVDEGDED